LSKGIIATVGVGPSVGSQDAETESIDRWELNDEQDRIRRKKEAAVKRVERLLMKQGKDAPLV
jgi:hypothetical protein